MDKLLRRYARKFPKTVRLILENDTVNIRCNRCGSVVLKETFVEDYPYQCICCDENMYGIETHKGKPHTEAELEELFEYIRDVLLLDDIDNKYIERSTAGNLLTSKRFLAGFELEDGELTSECSNMKQFLVRPITRVFVKYGSTGKHIAVNLQFI